MALVRGYSVFSKEEGDDGYQGEDGYIIIPKNIRLFLGLEPNEAVIINALRIEGTSRYPHAVLFLPHKPPKLSTAEVIMAAAAARVDAKGRIALPLEITAVLRLQDKYRVEMKVLGPHNGHWVMLYNRGPWRETTIRQRMGVKRGKSRTEKKYKTMTKKHKTMTWDY